ncbi:MAG TPA: zf-HC2 domain-containing protein [Blastocatellia bacterium]|nr:zf-HC2 domain-containing protein [Blastocatellia bacterium]
MTTCLTEDRLQAYLDGEFAADLAEAATNHLAECPACAGRADQEAKMLTTISDALSGQFSISVPSERLRSRIESRLGAPGDARLWLGAFIPRYLRIGLIAATVVALVTATMWVVIQRQRERVLPEINVVVIDSSQSGSETASKVAATETVDAVRHDQKRPKTHPSRDTSEAILASHSPAPGYPGWYSSDDKGFFDADTTRHLEKAEILLRSFGNTSFAKRGELAYDRAESKQLLYANILLRRQAETEENAPVESLLGNLEPILLDISNLPDRPRATDLVSVKERIRTSEIVSALQVYSNRITTLD